MVARLRPSIAAICVVAIALLGTSRQSHAQNAAAESLFADGERLMKEGKLREACDAFAASNKIEARAGTLINLGLCREQNGQLASAWSAFKDSLTRAKDPKKQQVANDRIAAIEPKLSYLTISVPDESRVDGLTLTRNGAAVDQVLWNRAVPVDGGTYTIVGRAPGTEEWSTTVEVPNELGKITIDVPRFKDLKQLVTLQQPKEEQKDEVEDQPDVESPGMFTPKRKIALGVAGVGVVALAGGIVLGIQAKGFQDDAYALCPDPAMPCPDGDQANSLIDKAHSRALVANISYGVAAGAIIGAGVLWFLGAPKPAESTVAVVPRVSPTTAAIDMTVRF